MRVARVIGTLTPNRCQPTLSGATFKLAVPLSLDELSSGSDPAAEELVLVDELGADDGSLILVSEGPEAAQPFRPKVVPIDAYNAALVDDIQLDFSMGNGGK